MPLKLYKRGEVWWYRGTVAGRRLHASAKTTDKEIAQRLANRAEAQAFKRDLDGPASVHLELGLPAERRRIADRHLVAAPPVKLADDTAFRARFRQRVVGRDRLVVFGQHGPSRQVEAVRHGRSCEGGDHATFGLRCGVGLARSLFGEQPLHVRCHGLHPTPLRVVPDLPTFSAFRTGKAKGIVGIDCRGVTYVATVHLAATKETTAGTRFRLRSKRRSIGCLQRCIGDAAPAFPYSFGRRFPRVREWEMVMIAAIDALRFNEGSLRRVFHNVLINHRSDLPWHTSDRNPCRMRFVDALLRFTVSVSSPRQAVAVLLQPFREVWVFIGPSGQIPFDIPLRDQVALVEVAQQFAACFAIDALAANILRVLHIGMQASLPSWCVLPCVSEWYVSHPFPQRNPSQDYNGQWTFPQENPDTRLSQEATGQSNRPLGGLAVRPTERNIGYLLAAAIILAVVIWMVG